MRFDTAREKCPCGQTTQVADKCCFKGGRWSPREPLQKLRAKTGYSHPACYASATADCSKTISGEHAFSRAVLEIIAPEGMLQVSGFPWLFSGTKSIGVGALTANILCVRHNSDLSPLDAAAAAFFRRVRDIAVEFNGKKAPGPSVLLLNGHVIERWALKVLCGAAFSGNASIKGNAIRGWCVPATWLDAVLGKVPLGVPRGLYFSGEGQTISSDPQMAFATMGPPDGLVGASIRMSGFQFVLAAEPMPVDSSGSDLKSANYRPGSMRFASDREERFVLLAWPKDPRGIAGNQVNIEWEPPTLGA